jgi:hypothetical protein
LNSYRIISQNHPNANTYLKNPYFGFNYRQNRLSPDATLTNTTFYD